MTRYDKIQRLNNKPISLKELECDDRISLPKGDYIGYYLLIAWGLSAVLSYWAFYHLTIRPAKAPVVYINRTPCEVCHVADRLSYAKYRESLSR